MSAKKLLVDYERLRQKSLWRILASDNACTTLAMLQTHLYDKETSLPTSGFRDRIERELDSLRADGKLLNSSSAAEYIAGWLRDDFIVRKFPAGAREEVYELSSSTVDAVRFLSGLLEPHAMATESRLSLVLGALLQLEQDTNTDKFKRIERLEAERDGIDRQIEAIHNGQMRILPHDAAVERAREIISLSESIISDFRRVREDFERLNRELREDIVKNTGSRGDVLESVFEGIDVIGRSDSGRSFTAFWRLLTDPEQSTTLEDAMDSLLGRKFMQKLSIPEKRALSSVTKNLLRQGGAVHEVLQHFARSLKHFVQSREFLEQRHLNQVLVEAQRQAIDVREKVRPSTLLNFTLELTGGKFRSFSHVGLFDPSLQAPVLPMISGDDPEITLETVNELVQQAEIDFRQLKENIVATLQDRSQASIGDVFSLFPPQQGLGSIVGMMSLGARHGVITDRSERIVWHGMDEQQRAAKIPAIYFLKDNIHALQ